MDPIDQDKFIQHIFVRTKMNEQAKYRKGQGIREIIFQKLALGEEVEGYRIDFLRNSVNRLFHFMEEIGTEFNKKYPEDRFTTNDFGDILATALNCLNNLDDGN